MRKSKFLQVALLLVVLVSFVCCASSSKSAPTTTTTITASNSDISQNLDLEAVATIFGQSKDLADFEARLNDPKSKISNLDLNNDGQVDYLRVVESGEGNTHVVILQAVLANDVYQDVATIDVERDNAGATQVQVVGDPYIYGPAYVITPVYYQPPVIYSFFWVSYNPWRSPYYWGYYPPYYHPWRPSPVYNYHRSVRVNVNVHNTYNYNVNRRSTTAINIEKQHSRNDYGRRYPEQSFSSRNSGKTNARDLSRNNVNNGGRRSTVTNSTRRNTVSNNVNNTRGTSGVYRDSSAPKRSVVSNKANEVGVTRGAGTSTQRVKPEIQNQQKQPTSRGRSNTTNTSSPSTNRASQVQKTKSSTKKTKSRSSENTDSRSTTTRSTTRN